MSTTNSFIKKTAIKTLVSESIVESIIKDQWKQLNAAIKSHKYYDHEVSGFAYFQLSRVKIESQLKKYTQILNGLMIKKSKAEQAGEIGKAKITELKILGIEKTLTNLISKIPAYESRLERAVKWDSEPIYRRAMDQRYGEGKTEDMS